MLNSINLTGRITKDLEMKYLHDGTAVSSFTLAVNRPYVNKSGEKEVDFITCVAWKKTAEIIANNLRKGSLIGITGRLQTRNYEGQDKKRVFVTEVIVEQVTFLESKKEEAPQQQQHYQRYGG